MGEMQSWRTPGTVVEIRQVDLMRESWNDALATIQTWITLLSHVVDTSSLMAIESTCESGHKGSLSGQGLRYPKLEHGTLVVQDGDFWLGESIGNLLAIMYTAR